MSSYGVSYLFSFSGQLASHVCLRCRTNLGVMIGLLFIPESPRWLAEKGHYDDAIRIMTRIEGRGSAEREIKASGRPSTPRRDPGANCLVPACAWPSSSVWHSAFSRWSGGTAVNFYGTVDFQKASSLEQVAPSFKL